MKRIKNCLSILLILCLGFNFLTSVSLGDFDDIENVKIEESNEERGKEVLEQKKIEETSEETNNIEKEEEDNLTEEDKEVLPDNELDEPKQPEGVVEEDKEVLPDNELDEPKQPEGIVEEDKEILPDNELDKPKQPEGVLEEDKEVLPDKMIDQEEEREIYLSLDSENVTSVTSLGKTVSVRVVVVKEEYDGEIVEEPIKNIALNLKLENSDGNSTFVKRVVTDKDGLLKSIHITEGRKYTLENADPHKEFESVKNPMLTFEFKDGKLYKIERDKEPEELTEDGLIINYYERYAYTISIAISENDKISNRLPGTEFEIREKGSDKIFKKVVAKDMQYTEVKGFVYGKTYIITETKALEGYAPAGPQEITIGDSRNYVIFKNKKGDPIKFKLVNEKDEELEGGYFYLERLENNETYTIISKCKTGEDGRFDFTVSTPGRYVVTERKSPSGYFNKTIVVYRFIFNNKKQYLRVDKDGNSFIIEKGEIQKITNFKATAIPIKLTKTDNNNNPMENVKFELVGDQIDRRWKSTDKNGYLEFENLPKGNYELREIKTKPGYKKNSTVRHFQINDGLETGEGYGNDVTSKIKMEEWKLKVYDKGKYGVLHNGWNELTIHPNIDGFLSFITTYKVKGAVRPGDFFKVEFSNNIDFGGIVPDNVLNIRNSFEIIGHDGIIAKAKIVKTGGKKYIKYTFTNYVESLNLKYLKTNVNVYLDKNVVKDYGYTRVYQKMHNDYNRPYGKRVYVNYDVIKSDQYYAYLDDYNNNNRYAVGGFVSEVDYIKNTYKSYIYVNPEGRNIYNGNIKIMGNENVPDISNDEVKIYKVDNPSPSTMLPGYDYGGKVPSLYSGIKDYNYFHIHRDYRNNNIYINFEDTMKYGRGYIIEINGNINAGGQECYVSVNEDLKLDKKDLWYKQQVSFVKSSAYGDGDKKDIEYNFTNYPNKIDFIKTNEEGNALAGAEFKLEVKNKNEWVRAKQVDLNGNMSEIPNQISGVNGKISFEKLPDGDYRLVEEKAPEGYVILEEPKEFTVSDGNILKAGSEEELSLKDCGIPNPKMPAELPLTGNNERVPFEIMGVLAVITASILYMKRKEA